MDIEAEIGELRSLQRLVMERIEIQTDMLGDLKEVVLQMVQAMNEPASSELSDALRHLATVVAQLTERLAALPHNVADELERRRSQ